MALFQWLGKGSAKDQRPAARVPEEDSAPPVRRRFCFSGRVQGVGFRYEARMLALQLGLTGWVENKSDGTVVVEAEGGEARIHGFLRAIQTVSRFEITNVEVEDLPPTGADKSFRVRY